MLKKVAILGAGIGQQHLSAYLEVSHLFEVVLIVDQDISRAKALAGTSGIAVSKKIETALADPAVDIIDICLPPHLHVSTSLFALKAGKHVICEKPVSTSLSELDAIRTETVQTNRRFYPVFQYRWGRSLTVLRYLKETGLTGAPHLASIETHWDRGAEYYATAWRGTWAGEMGGAVLGHAIHNHGLLTHFMGPVSEVSAITATRINPIETEDCAALSFKMKNGALATSSITLGNATSETRLRFVFEHLTATSGTEPYAPGAVPWRFIARDPSKQATLEDAIDKAPTERDGFAGFFEEIAKDIDGQPNSAVTLNDGYQSISLVTAIYLAACTGNVVNLPISQDDPFYSGWQPDQLNP